MKQASKYILIGLGEILWDIFPGGRGKQLGGAPANFAFHANALGNCGIPASRVGQDSLGLEIMELLKGLGVTREYIQKDSVNPTGTVEVSLDSQGKPSFEIVEDVAWDFIDWTESLNILAGKSDAVCFGSLAQRSACSRKTIQTFLRSTRRDSGRIFDVNLRQSYYSKEILSESLSISTIVKLNSSELPELVDVMGLKNFADTADTCRKLLDDYKLELVCVTNGESGSLLVMQDRIALHPGFPVTVADTVGSGDAFTAVLVHHYIRESPLEKISEAANAYGAWVASQAGATPSAPPGILEKVLA